MSSTRDTSFIPLTPVVAPANQRPDFRVTVRSQAENTQPFRPLGQPADGAAPPGHGPGCEPRVTIQREGDRVSVIQIQCACGQLIELACIYEAAPAAV
jgi:hypothetical protein